MFFFLDTDSSLFTSVNSATEAENLYYYLFTSFILIHLTLMFTYIICFSLTLICNICES